MLGVQLENIPDTGKQIKNQECFILQGANVDDNIFIFPQRESSKIHLQK